MDEIEENGIQDIDAFEKKLKNHRGTILSESGSSSDEELDVAPLSMHSNENVKLQAKVKMLIQQVIDKDREIESLRNVLGYAKPEPENNEYEGDFRDQKLMELAKKVRTLQVALESEKNRAARAMEEVNKLREENFKKENTKGWSRNTIKEEPEKKSINYEKILQETQLKYTNIKNELKKAKNLLQREVGEFESIDSLMKNESWKGRAQQIEIMKSRIADLKRQVNRKVEDTVSSMPSVKIEGSADERRKEIQSLQEQLQKAKEEAEKGRKKVQGISSRMTALEKENREIRETHKAQIKTLLDKTENDDRFIAELKNEIDRIKKAKGYPRLEPVPAAGNKEAAELKWQIANLHQNLYQTQQELEEKTKLVEMFQQLGEQKDEVQNELEYKQQIKLLEDEVKRLKDSEKKSGNNEDGKLIKELSSQNARLRNKVNDLTEELSKLRKTIG